MGVNCEQVQREISDYLDGELEAASHAALAEHLRGCQPCTALHDGLRNLIRLYGDPRMLELPLGFSQRLRRRINQSVQRPRGTLYGWVLAAAASLLIIGGLELGSLSAFTRPQLRSRLADPARSDIPETMLVVVATDGKTFHGGRGCPYMHDKSKERILPAGEAIREGYTPCTRCMRQYLSARSGLLRFPDDIGEEIAGLRALDPP